jgi:hypothetical protein
VSPGIWPTPAHCAWSGEGPGEARDRWAKLTLPQRREIIFTLMVVRIRRPCGDEDVPSAVGRGGVARNMNIG